MHKEKMLSKRIICFVSVVTLAFFASQAKAQELMPDHVKLARELVEMNGTARSIIRILPAIGAQTYARYERKYPELTDDLADMAKEVTEDMLPSKSELLDQYARHYALRFSAEELTEILTFFKGDIGKRLIAETPAITRDNLSAMKVWRDKATSDFHTKFKAGMKEKGHIIE